MGGTEGHFIVVCGSLIELLAAFVVVYHAGLALISLMRDHAGDQARLLIAQGVLAALGFSLAGTLLKTIGLESWTQIRSFAFVWLLRTLLKKVFQREQLPIASRTSAMEPPP